MEEMGGDGIGNEGLGRIVVGGGGNGGGTLGGMGCLGSALLLLV